VDGGGSRCVVGGDGGGTRAGRGLCADTRHRRLLYGAKAIDPPVFAVVSLLLLAVAAGASFVPALQAARVDPMGA